MDKLREDAHNASKLDLFEDSRAAMNISVEQLLQWNRLGIIPGPDETLEEYERRAAYCLGLMETLPAEHGGFIPDQVMEKSEGPLTEEAWGMTRERFDFAPTWTPLFFTNHELAPWHGGCAWIFQTSESSPLGALFQLRRVFRDKETFLGIYHRKVLLAHEAVHVARMAFREPKFEELIAYRTSNSTFQRYFGPLVETSREAALFVLTVFLIIVINLGAIGMGAVPGWIVWLNAVPLAMACGAVLRLWIRQKQYARLLNKLSGRCEKPEAVLCRLSDSEIIGWGKKSVEAIGAEIKELAESSYRWKIIASYLKN